MVAGPTPLEGILQEELKTAGDNGASAGVLRMYRKMSLGTLHALDPAKLPGDLGALHVLVQASELYAYAMYMAGFGGATLTFSEKGLGETVELLCWCQAFFSHTAFIAPNLPPSFEGQVDLEKHARACATDLAALIAKLQDSGAPDADERAEGVTEEGEATAVTITTDTFTSLAKALLVVIFAWMDDAARTAFTKRFTRDYQEAQELRSLVPGLFPNADGQADPDQALRREVLSAVAASEKSAAAVRTRGIRRAGSRRPPPAARRRAKKAKPKAK